MKYRKKIKIIGLCLAALITFLLFYERDSFDKNKIDKTNIESFDLILSKGQSAQSKLISFLRFSMNDFSHIGILEKSDDQLFVLHSTPDGTKRNGIRYDSLQIFIELSKVSEFEILRYHNISESKRIEIKKVVDYYKSVQRPFDFYFDNKNNKKIYCSELIWLIFNKTGLLEMDDFNIKRPIFPIYFKDHKNFDSVNSSELAKNQVGFFNKE